MSAHSKQQCTSDAFSIVTASSTSSTKQLLKSNLFPKGKASLKPIDERSPGEKQAERRAGRLNAETLGTLAALR